MSDRDDVCAGAIRSVSLRVGELMAPVYTDSPPEYGAVRSTLAVIPMPARGERRPRITDRRAKIRL